MTHTTKYVSVQQWADDFKDHPIQRNTAKRAKKTLKTHLKEAHVVHQHVVGALYDNQLYKVDGHTRSYLWTNNLLDRPSEVIVTLFEVKTYQELITIFKCYDNKSAAETTADIYYGACRNIQFEAKSALVKRGGISTVFQLITGLKDACDIINYTEVLLPAIKKVDDLMFSTKYSVAAYTAMLLTFLSSKCIEDDLLIANFWQNINNNIGRKDEFGIDAHQGAIETIAFYKTYKSISRQALNETLCSLLLACYINRIGPNKFKSRPTIGKAINIQNFARAHIRNYSKLGISFIQPIQKNANVVSIKANVA